MKEYYTLINQQSFVRAKEEPAALRIWIKVFLDSISLIIDEYKDSEMVELLLFKLPWFSSQSTHSRYFRYFLNLVFAIFPRDPSYLHKVISHAFSPFGFFQCILNGEIRSSISELLWEKALSIIQKRQDFSEEEVGHLHLTYKSLKSAEEILNRAKVILKSYSDQVPIQASSGITKQLKKVTIKEHDIFLKALFSFSPTKNLNENFDYPIFVGTFQEIPGFFVMEEGMPENCIPCLDDFVSLKKCICSLNDSYSVYIEKFASEKSEKSPLKYMSTFLIKLLKTYPLTQQVIFKHLQDRIPHKKQSVENQLIYNQVIFQILKQFPSKEKHFLCLIIEKLTQMDIEIKVKSRRIHKGSLQVQDLESYHKEMKVRIQDENQIKLGLLFDQLLTYFKEKVMNLSSRNDNYEEDLLYIFKRKIFTIQKLNFLQYLPLYLMNLKSEKNQVADLFTKKLLSFLILTSFNLQGEENSVIRQHAFNYLSSFLSRQNSIIDEDFFLKCVTHILNGYKNEEEVDPIFKHCIVQGLALLISTKGNALQTVNVEMYQQILDIVFKKEKNSLQYCQTIVLQDLILQSKQSEQPELRKLQEILKKSLNSQKENQSNSKRHIFTKVSKFLPYEQPLILIGVQKDIKDLLTYEIIASTELMNEEDTTISNPVSSQDPPNKSRLEDLEEIKVSQSNPILYDPKEFQTFLKQNPINQGYNSSDEIMTSNELDPIKQQRSHSSNQSEFSNEETQHSVDNQFSQTLDKLTAKAFSPKRRFSPTQGQKKQLNMTEQAQKVRRLNDKPQQPFSHNN